MPDHPNITPELLRQLLRYEPDTGKLFWLPRTRESFASARAFKTWNSRFCGREAFTHVGSDGYRRGKIFGNLHLAHRIVWILSNSEIPKKMDIDHVSGVRGDNRLKNLRLASRSQNRANTCVSASSTSGIKGVHWHKATQKWAAVIRVSGKQKHLGFFFKISEAEAAYLAAAEEYQGQFAYHNRKNHG
jgi:hypothetical protein